MKPTMYRAMPLALVATFVLVAGCASQPPPAEPRRAESQPATKAPERAKAPPPREDPRQVADLLNSVLPEPVQAGKNPVTPIDTGTDGTRGPVTCLSACKRVIGDCLLETIQATGKISQKQIESIRKSGMLDKIRAQAQKSCQKSCNKPGTKNYARIQAMKPCALKSTCVAVGACAAKHIK